MKTKLSVLLHDIKCDRSKPEGVAVDDAIRSAFHLAQDMASKLRYARERFVKMFDAVKENERTGLSDEDIWEAEAIIGLWEKEIADELASLGFTKEQAAQMANLRNP